MQAELATLSLGRRLWRYAPLIAWILVIFFASSENLSASSTSRFVRPVILWFFPNISESGLMQIHFLVRKSAHFLEFTVLGLLAARAFESSTHYWLRQSWAFWAMSLVVVCAFLDEYRQSFIPIRSASVWDSLIDIASGVTALVIFACWRRRRSYQRNVLNLR